MPITLNLVDDGWILHYIDSDPWTAGELLDLNVVTEKYYRDTTHKIHTLTDASKLRTVPSGILRARNVPNLSHPNSGEIAIVGAAILVEKISSAMFRIAHFTRVKFFGTEPEAWAYLRDIISRESKEIETKPEIAEIPVLG